AHVAAHFEAAVTDVVASLLLPDQEQGRSRHIFPSKDRVSLYGPEVEIRFREIVSALGSESIRININSSVGLTHRAHVSSIDAVIIGAWGGQFFEVAVASGGDIRTYKSL